MRAYRTVKCQKRLVFALRVLHTLLLQFVCDKCIRVTFGTRMSTRTQTFVMFVYENNTYHTHTQYFIHTFHTNTKPQIVIRKERRQFVPREYFRVLATQNK